MIAGSGRWSRAQIAGVGGAVVVVVALFAFMVLNSGSDGPSEEVSAEGSTPSLSTTSTTEASEPDAPSPTAAPMPTAVPSTEPEDFGPEDVADGMEDTGEDLAPGENNPAFPVDGARFCAGATNIGPLEGAFAGAFAAGDLEGVRRAVAEHREAWTTGVTDMVEGGPPRYRVDIERYRDVYQWLFGIVDTDGDLERLGNGYPPEYRDRSANPDDPIAAAIREHCG